MNGATAYIAAIGYVLFLFLIAWWGDRGGRRFLVGRKRTLVYALSLAVYCTSWTYYGSVGLASSHGLDFLPIYIGPILVIGLGSAFVGRIANLARTQNLTTVADFVSARYGKSPAVAAIAALIALVGSAPYVALQLKAVSTTLLTVVDSLDKSRFTPDKPSALFSLAIALGLAAFAIAFGTRRINPKEHQNGLILAIAVESIVKLGAFLAVGAFVVWGLNGGLSGLTQTALSNPKIAAVIQTPPGPRRVGGDHAAIGLRHSLAAAAVSCGGRRKSRSGRRARRVLAVSRLSRADQPVRRAARRGRPQFVSGRRDRSRSDGARASARGGRARRGAGDDDRRAVGGDRHGGGRQPRAGDHHLQRPRHADLLRRRVSRDAGRGGGDIGALVLWVRAAVHCRGTGAGLPVRAADGRRRRLVSIGLLSFAAVAQIAPAFLGGLFWRRGTARGAIAGMAAGSLAWLYLLLLPSLEPKGRSRPSGARAAGDRLAEPRRR